MAANWRSQERKLIRLVPSFLAWEPLIENWERDSCLGK